MESLDSKTTENTSNISYFITMKSKGRHKILSTSSSKQFDHMPYNDSQIWQKSSAITIFLGVVFMYVNWSQSCGRLLRTP